VTSFPMATPRVAAGALIRDEGGDVLLVRPTYKPGWDIPGGYVEPGESPAMACARELVEELGWHRRIGHLLVVDWAPHPDEGDKMLFIFDGGVLPSVDVDQLVPDGEELSDVRFHPVDGLAGVTPARLSRRLGLAVAAVQDGRTIYAEHGYEPADLLDR
jgi:8-oxo-dGTP diphosphatase